MTAELAVILLNLVLVCGAYFWFYPRVAGADLRKVALFDLLTTVLALLIVGSKFWNSNQQFDLVFGTSNWFWFTLLTYLILETPLALWYVKRHGTRQN